jgi:hypothetical protein
MWGLSIEHSSLEMMKAAGRCNALPGWGWGGGGGCAVGDFFGALGVEDGSGLSDVIADLAFGCQGGWVDGEDAAEFVKVFDQGFAKVERLGLQEFARGAFWVEGGAIGFGNVDH